MKVLRTIPLLAAAASAGAAEFSSEDLRFFREEVRPLLEANCFECHGGTDARGQVKIKSGLQLISRKGITQGGDHGPAFDAANPEKSLLLHVIGYEDEDLKMPPRAQLAEADRAVLAEWVKRGLPWTPEDADFLHDLEEEHAAITEVNETTKSFWSYKPLERPEVPRVADPKWNENPIDAFLYHKLAGQGLEPNEPAGRRELIRRATFDLTGLPPTLEEVEAFENDTTPDAWEKVIERLLASPHYGEKWARHWLDVVRYAETNGFERDSEKPHIWRYRDYVIKAFNEDKPYDQFLLEQLAGDEIAEPTVASMVATGYHRLMQWDDEPADRLQHMFDNLDDDVRITAEGMLAMTIGCARCHDHKGDPISQEDYFSFMAFFRGVTQPGKDKTNIEKVGSEGQAGAQTLEAHEAEGRRLAAELAQIERELEAQLIESHPLLRGRLSEEPAQLKPLLADARTDRPASWHYTTEKPADDWSAVGFRAENAGWKEGTTGFGTRGTPGARVHTRWRASDLWAQASFLLEDVPNALALTLHHDEDVEIFLNGQPVLSRMGHRTDYEEIEADQKFLGALQTGRNVVAVHVRHTMGGQYFDFGVAMAGSETYTLDEALAQAREDSYDPVLLAKRRDLQRAIAAHAQARPETGAIEANVVQEAGTSPPDLHVHIRGNAGAPSDTVVTTRVPGIFGGQKLEGAPPEHGRKTSGRRLALAEWITRDDNPRTPRVMVNRIWQHHFGRGICPTPNDFGYLGEPPTHPELLDWLATEFVRRDWSMKAMHRLLMTSQAYRMSSRGRPDGLAKDPANTWWWRFDMRRLTAEELRDSLLAVTGRLNPKMGGPSVYMDLPPEVLATSSKKGDMWGQSPPEERVRRSVYMKVKRSLVPPIMADFDLANTDETCPVRFSSILPTQALALLNSDLANKEAKHFAERLRAEAPDDPKRRIELALELALARPATVREVEYGQEFVEVMMREHKLSSEEAFERFALLVLNLNEFVFVD